MREEDVLHYSVINLTIFFVYRGLTVNITDSFRISGAYTSFSSSARICIQSTLVPTTVTLDQNLPPPPSPVAPLLAVARAVASAADPPNIYYSRHTPSAACLGCSSRDSSSTTRETACGQADFLHIGALTTESFIQVKIPCPAIIKVQLARRGGSGVGKQGGDIRVNHFHFPRASG